ncbi:MAG: electron transfer flavoprotein subunit alpha/FixB family protein [Actinobacteria bacterium]|nr:electron transfer flavoprotein subunit alpha/FixB family protein [Actinomycetota bacterium]
MATTWVFTEEVAGAPSSTSLEMLTKARSLGGDLAAVYVGTGSPEAFAAVGAHGATRVFHIDPGDALPAAGVTGALAALAAEHEPDLILFGMGFTDRDVAGRLSAALDRPVLANAVDLEVDGDAVTVVSEILGGTQIVKAAFTGPKPWLGIVRPKAFPAEPGDGGDPEVVGVPMGEAGPAVIAARHEEAAEGPQLADANVVVTGGRGIGSAEKWSMVTDLASLLGAAVGATRAVVDAEWTAYSLQVGQTGQTVKPDVYLALGVSGAMQHLVGMKDSGTIIAVNKDEEAPIFEVADLGVVGDVHKVVPALIETLRARG